MQGTKETDEERPGSRVEQDPTTRFSVQGETVAATRYEPVDIDGPLPAVLWYTPYHKDDETTFGRYDPLLEYIAAHGYEVVVADMIGTGSSTGHRDEILGPDTGAEVEKVIEEIADRDWTTESVGMIGKSFPGVLCLAAGAENPDPLDAIVPILTTHRRERMGFKHGGLPNLWLTISMVALYTATGVQPPSRRDSGWEEMWRDRLDHYREEGPLLSQTFNPDPTNSYWDLTVPVEDINVPTFSVGGYRDHFPTDTLDYFEAIDAPKRLLMGPWRHVIPFQGRETAVGFRSQTVNWFDRFLKDENVEPFEPTIAYWTERNGGRQVNEGIWRGCETWPSVEDEDEAEDENADILSFAATPDGLKPKDDFGSGRVERTHDVDHTVGLEAHDLSVQFVDTNADDARSMVFETAPFEHPIELTGTGKVRVQLSVDGTLPLCVRLVDRAPDGRARPITRGSVRVEDTDDPVTVPLEPVSHVVEEGHRLRVAISAADFPSHVPVGTGDSFTVTSTPNSPTVIQIPGTNPLPETFEETVSIQPPDDTFPLLPPAIKGVDASWETTREHEHGSATRRRQVTTDYVFPHVEKPYELDIEASIAHDDPSTLDARATIETVLEHDDGPVTVEATAQRDLEGTTVEATVLMDGDPVFHEEW